MTVSLPSEKRPKRKAGGNSGNKEEMNMYPGAWLKLIGSIINISASLYLINGALFVAGRRCVGLSA
jgi:hypothetical protein